MKKLLFIIFILISISSTIDAAEINVSSLAQSELDSFTKQIGFLLSRRQYNGAAPLGLIGFNVGAEATAVKLDNTSLWNKAYSTSSAPSYIAAPIAHVNKGLPFGIDLGVRAAVIPNTKLSLMGGEIRYAPLKGSIVTPAVNIFIAYSVLNGAKNFDMNSISIGSSVSKGFGIITPYAGISLDQNKLTPDSSIPLLKETTKKSVREFVGAKLNFLILSLCAEADFGEMQSYGLSLDFGF